MTRAQLLRRSLVYYWRSNLAVVAGVAAAVAVLAGALLVGESVRSSLRTLAIARLGATDTVVMSPRFFREALADDVRRDAGFVGAFRDVVPAIAVDAIATAQESGRRAGHVRLYGVDDRFWRFHGISSDRALDARQAFVSPALADAIGAAGGTAILIRVEQPSDIPIESLHGRKDDPGRTLRVTVRSVLGHDELGEFSLEQTQGRILAAFVPLAQLQAELDRGGRVNTLLLSAQSNASSGAAALAPIVQRVATLDDRGLTLRTLTGESTIVVSADAGLIDPIRADAAGRAATSLGLRHESVFTYLATTLRTSRAAIPYSLVAARDLTAMLPATKTTAAALPPIVLNEWAARDLGARPGDTVALDYLLWEDTGRFAERSAEFTLASIVPIGAGDRDLTPVFPGITDSPTLDSWNPPFPFDLRRVRPIDEEYWKQHRTSPKAFIALADGQRLWGTRYGNVTSVRISSPAAATPAGDLASLQQRYEIALRTSLDPAAAGLIARDVRAEALAASNGVTDFGQYFVYFSFFIVVSALVLTALFFKLGVEQRVREIGLLSAVGARASFVRSQLLAEAAILSVIGGAIGAAGAVAYAAIIIRLLGTRWVGAVGTTAIALDVSPVPLIAGVVGGIAAAWLCTLAALRSLSKLSGRALLAGEVASDAVAIDNSRASRSSAIVIVALVLSALFIGAGVWGWLGQVAAFFGAAAMLIVAGLSGASGWFRRTPSRPLHGHGVRALIQLGFRNAAARPARSALSIAVIASATFILLAVDAFRKDAVADTGPASGVGGYAIAVESLLPMAYDISTKDGRDALGLTGVDDLRFEPFRLRSGDDASCLNLYQPANPRILGVRDEFIAAGRFRFARSLAETDAERANPWRLLARTFPDGAVPVIADANSLAYVLHKSLGEDIDIETGQGPVLRLRVVAALSDSIFQRELLMHASAFMRAFPEDAGYRFVLVEAPPSRIEEMSTAIEDRLSAFGADAVPAADQLAAFHRVENTYLATFQMLGALGLLLGTVGLGAVLIRNVIERRRDLALLGAVGFRPAHVRTMLLAESLSLLVIGVTIGLAAAMLATVPAMIERGARVPVSLTGALLVGAVLVSGTFATVLAARVAIRQPLLSALRSE